MTTAELTITQQIQQMKSNTAKALRNKSNDNVFDLCRRCKIVIIKTFPKAPPIPTSKVTNHRIIHIMCPGEPKSSTPSPVKNLPRNRHRTHSVSLGNEQSILVSGRSNSRHAGMGKPVTVEFLLFMAVSF